MTAFMGIAWGGHWRIRVRGASWHLGLALTPLIVCEIVKGVHRAAHPKTVQETAAAPH